MFPRNVPWEIPPMHAFQVISFKNYLPNLSPNDLPRNYHLKLLGTTSSNSFVYEDHLKPTLMYYLPKLVP
jgi:hypothetical protein